MAGLVIAIAQRKGGAGKTTLAAQLAIAWARCGARVASLDTDPQGSLAAWVDLRRARLGSKAIGFEFAALPGWRATQWIEDRAPRRIWSLSTTRRMLRPRRGCRCARQSWC